MYEIMYVTFLNQDYENEYFDVIFDVQGKELYAHSSILTYHSSVFQKQFIKNRSKRNEPIHIVDYTYDEFKEFIRLFYLAFYSDYAIDQTHTHALIELADMYEVEHIKEVSEGYYKYHDDHIFEDLVFAHKHSLEYYMSSEYLSQLTELDEFSKLDISDIKIIVDLALDSGIKEEDIYKAVYKWGEHQAMVNDEMTNEEKNELVFYYIKDILPFTELDFKKVTNKFVFEFAVPKGLISIEEANKYATIKVSIKCGDKKITGSFVDYYGILEFIESKKYYEHELIGSGTKKQRLWNEKFAIPSTPSTIEKMKGFDWYLLFNAKRKLYVKHQSMIKTADYLIAEMKASRKNGDDIVFDQKVCVTASRKQS